MGILRIKNSKGEWVDIPAIKGADGKDGEVTLEQLKSITGELENLPTEDKSSLVNAIIEVVDNLGSGSGITELTKSTALYNQPYGIYKVSESVSSFISISLTTFGVTTGFQGHPGEIFIWTKDESVSWVIRFKTAYPGLIVECYRWTQSNDVVYKYEFNLNDLTKAIVKDKATTISAIHSYSALPESSVVPTKDNQLVNKKYVDDAIKTAITTVLEGEY